MSSTGIFSVDVDLGVVLAKLVKAPGYQKPKITVSLTGPVTICHLVDYLGIPREYISFVTVNSEKKDWASSLGPGDKIILFPYITGG
ncbi:Mut7-C ubiquitin [Desulfotomaculum arcticum]|uniref:Mut7-C ubiquitin n=1 Tax=Desulfotruncus arcticus DSM 17038 TaxID=1121424 RepID=A0A1I2X022_9FIRM|nr:MoaD/ThiS family protein [Desulfotruncus arcticus]SFH06046.1 Mut7-C ubiquitin [Desulfotomaculum arcticum] [Desulfotruncus arcticus DSM 17038]